MKCIYPVLPELVKDASGDTGKFAITPGMIHFFAKIANLSQVFIKVPKDFQKKAFKIQSYDGQTFQSVLYTPDTAGDRAPCLIYYPGGGFVVGAYPYMHTIAMMYGRNAKCKVLFVNYRLANAPCYTAAIEDAYAALKYVWDNAEALGIDKGRIAVAGDSAGATLATVVSMMARDRRKTDGNGPKVKFQMMMYPMTACCPQTWSREHFTNTPGINSEWAKVFVGEALKNGMPEKREYIEPLKNQNFEGIPAAYIETEEFCPLRDEGNLYAEKMSAHGVSVIHNPVKGTFHAFDSSLKRDVVQKMIAYRSEILKKGLL